MRPLAIILAVVPAACIGKRSCIYVLDYTPLWTGNANNEKSTAQTCSANILDSIKDKVMGDDHKDNEDKPHESK